MKRNGKRGFTIVELVVVIAVVAILAAVLIPTFASVIKKANVSDDIVLVKQLNDGLKLEEVGGKKNDTMTDALKVAKEYGFDVEKLTPRSSGEILWDSVNNRFVLLDENGDAVYKDESKTLSSDDKLWKIVDNAEAVAANTKYNSYIKGNATIDTLTVNGGVDVGENTVTELTYANTTGTAKTVDIRTNGGNLTVNAATDEVNHYDNLNTLNVEAVASNSYHEYGSVGFVSVISGRVEVKEGAKVVTVYAAATTAKIDAAENTVENAYAAAGVTNDGNLTLKEVPAGKTIESIKAAAVDKAFPTPSVEKDLVLAMNEAIAGYNGESVMKAIEYMAANGKTVTVSDLVHSDSAKTFAFDTTAKKFYIVNAASGEVEYPAGDEAEGDLIYIVNGTNSVSVNMTKIYFNDFAANDYALRKSFIVKVKTRLTHAEIGGNIKYIYTELTFAAKKENGSKTLDEQAALETSMFDSSKACFKDFTALSRVYVGSNVNYIGRAAFSGCKKLSYVYYNSATEGLVYHYAVNWNASAPFESSGSAIDLVYGKDVKVIPCLFGSNVYNGKEITSVTFEEGIRYTRIGLYAFNGMKCLTEINVPSTCTLIEGSSANGAFANTKLNKVIWNGDSITVNDVVYGKNNALGHGSMEELARFFGYSGVYGNNGSDFSLVVGEYEYKPENCTAFSGTIKVYKNGELQYTATETDEVWSKN